MHTILLVDDDFALLKLLKALLDGAGFHVLAAKRAHEALKMCRQTTIDLLLTDVNLPDLTGPELAMYVVNLEPGVRVLYMSGSDAENLSGMGLSWIESGVLRKPFSPADLLNAVDGALDLYPAAAASSDPKSIREHVPTRKRHSFLAAKQPTIEPGWPKTGSSVRRQLDLPAQRNS